ncbi:Site-specific recombinase XerD [Chryseobacterium ureilyticum]|uniref:Site-specific recombinase XerD n=1 Tax=Chryseobacterium ureilyticum TaxID=373668 RepID=A0A1N7LEN0_9FLAO|nr:site-specific integrase [Chryseobacterium ureilyticum]SIS72302.1 Site-specific recombinase XerD [Chryseobacterium ureilyticum]
METTKRSTFKLLFYLKKNAPKKNGTVSIMARLTINGRISQFSTKLEINPQQWDLKYSRVNGKSREAMEINQRLDKIRGRIEQYYLRILDKDGTVTSEKLKNTFLGLDSNELTLLQFLDNFIVDFKKKVASGTRSKVTCFTYSILRNNLAGFIMFNYAKTDMVLKEINCAFVQDFDYYMRNEKKNSQNTIWLYMVSLRTIIKLAISRKLLYDNPFVEYCNIRKDTDRGYLMKKELEALIEYKPMEKNIEYIKDMFLFSCFTGLSYGDIKRLDKSHIREFFDGNTWIILRRKKTRISSNVLLLDIPKKIIAKYDDTANNNLLFSMLGNRQCNVNLKKLIEEVECLKGKKISFHVARHTFATLFLSEGVPLESLSKMMGHKNIGTTQIYAKILNEKVGRDMEEVSHNFKELEAAFS